MKSGFLLWIDCWHAAIATPFGSITIFDGYEYMNVFSYSVYELIIHHLDATFDSFSSRYTGKRVKREKIKEIPRSLEKFGSIKKNK